MLVQQPDRFTRDCSLSTVRNNYIGERNSFFPPCWKALSLKYEAKVIVQVLVFPEFHLWPSPWRAAQMILGWRKDNNSPAGEQITKRRARTHTHTTQKVNGSTHHHICLTLNMNTRSTKVPKVKGHGRYRGEEREKSRTREFLQRSCSDFQ